MTFNQKKKFEVKADFATYVKFRLENGTGDGGDTKLTKIGDREYQRECSVKLFTAPQWIHDLAQIPEEVVIVEKISLDRGRFQCCIETPKGLESYADFLEILTVKDSGGGKVLAELTVKAKLKMNSLVHSWLVGQYKRYRVAQIEGDLEAAKLRDERYRGQIIPE